MSLVPLVTLSVLILSFNGLFTWRWGPQTGDVTCGRSPHLLHKCDQIKMRDYMDMWVTPPKLVTWPTWGPLPPCKQALTCTGGRDFSKIGEREWFSQKGQRKRYKTIKSWTKIPMKIFFHHPPSLPSWKRREGGKVKGKSWDCDVT